MKIRLLTLILITILLLGMLSCVYRDDDGAVGAIAADDDTVASVKRELEDMEISLLASEGDVFWTKSGTLWHSSYKCSYIINSKTVYHGSVEDAMLEGKVKACERCSATLAEQDIWEQLEKNSVLDGDVFFTRDGDVWHTFENCGALGYEKVYHGSRAIAILLGKTVECDECGDR